MEKQEKNNLELWREVEKTNPKYTKNAKVGGNQITCIAPQFQIMNATEQFGSYGVGWGFKNIELDYSLVNTNFKMNKTEGKWPNIKVVGKEDSTIGLVIFKAIFFYPKGEFEIINSISLFTDNARTKIDNDFAKKVETDTLTKALSKLGFNADIFLGKFDDQRYFEDVTKEFAPAPEKVEPIKKPVLNDSQFSRFLNCEKEILLKGFEDYSLTNEQTLELTDKIESL